MQGIFIWVNDNKDFLTLVFSLLACIAAFRSARAAYAQVKELRRQYAEENRPLIEVEFLFEKRAFCGLRFINHGRRTANNVSIKLNQSFVDSLPESNYIDMLRNAEKKSCVIGVEQHYDLFIGSVKGYKQAESKQPAKGHITYESNGQVYESDFEIDMENYVTIYTINNGQEDMRDKFKEQNKELEEIRKAIQTLPQQARLNHMTTNDD